MMRGTHTFTFAQKTSLSEFKRLSVHFSTIFDELSKSIVVIPGPKTARVGILRPNFALGDAHRVSSGVKSLVFGRG